MKKLLSLLMAALLLTAFCSCAKPEKNTETAATNEPVETVPTQEAASPAPAKTETSSFTAAPAETAAPSAEATVAPAVTETPARADDTPAATESAENSPDPYGTQEIINAGTLPVSYSGAVLDCTELAVGDMIEWTLDLSSEDSCLCSGLWLIDYPEEYLSPVGYSVDWEGSLTQHIYAAQESGEAESDIPVFACNPRYEGQTGESPFGEPGNMYSLLMMYLATFDHSGVQAKGPMVQIVFELTAIPADNMLSFDDAGGFVSIPITVLESRAMEASSEGVPHSPVSVTDGKLYFSH